jgi:hypothetical protein
MSQKVAMMRPITQQERAAMWLYHERYAAQRGGAIEFYAALTASEQRVVQQMLDELCPKAARPL